MLSNKLCGGTHYFGKISAYKNNREGVLTYQGFGNLVLDDIKSLDNRVGVALMNAGSEFSYLTLKNSIFFGESSVLPPDAGGYCTEVYALYSTGATSGGKVFPEKAPSKHPLDGITSEATWFTEGSHDNNTFKNWLSGTRQH